MSNINTDELSQKGFNLLINTSFIGPISWFCFLIMVFVGILSCCIILSIFYCINTECKSKTNDCCGTCCGKCKVGCVACCGCTKKCCVGFCSCTKSCCGKSCSLCGECLCCLKKCCCCILCCCPCCGKRKKDEETKKQMEANTADAEL
mmetsp:Transcript_81810/g.100356  ORF Transcript_81810/g.100356 Transcript_81810/m.100356 type:complete len:148 (-) Transcript_81810:235-678(-)